MKLSKWDIVQTIVVFGVIALGGYLIVGVLPSQAVWGIILVASGYQMVETLQRFRSQDRLEERILREVASWRLEQVQRYRINVEGMEPFDIDVGGPK